MSTKFSNSLTRNHLPRGYILNNLKTKRIIKVWYNQFHGFHKISHTECIQTISSHINNLNLSNNHNLHYSNLFISQHNHKQHNTKLYQLSQRYFRQELPREPQYDYKKQNVHSSQGDQPNMFQRGVLHVARKTSYADIALYVISVWVTFFGLAYLSAPLYRMLCQRYGWGGAITRKVDSKLNKLAEWREKSEKRGKNRKLLIRFDSRTGAGMPWDFEPVQNYVITRPGESTLAFFTAHNTSINPMTGLSTYTVLPFKAAPYFIKIQCFCFEEQRLRGHEIVDMPVLFFVDPTFLDDPNMFDVEEITLSYIFYPVVDDGEEELDDEDDIFWEEDAKSEMPDLSDIINDNDGQTGQSQPQLQM